MTLTFPLAAFWVGSMVAAMLGVRAWGLWREPGLPIWLAVKATLLALAVFVVGMAPLGYQEYRARAVQRESENVLASFQEFTRGQGIEATPGVPGRGEWWAVPYSFKDGQGNQSNAVLLTTGKDAQGKQVWLRIQ